MAVGTIGRYRVIRPLGTGGMGEVLLAEDTMLERRVALKIMSAELARDENQRKRFRTEAKSASALSHPNICVIHEVGETDEGLPFLAMEYVDGRTLDRVEQQRRFRIREILDIGIEVADALEAAHRCRLVHRDIKPSNIMLDARGHVKILDFGLAKRVVTEESSVTHTSSAAHTRIGYLVGTPHYMSPEQALGLPLDGRTDIFSLGAVLYELLVGQRPFLGRTVGEVVNHVVNQTPEPLGLENPLYSPELDRIVFKCLEKDPNRRYASAKLLGQDLVALKRNSEQAAPATLSATAQPVPAAAANTPATPLATDTASRPQPRVLSLSWTGLVLVLLLAGLLAFLLHDNHPRRAPAEKSVAVLPFDNFSADRDTDYLSDGLTEEVTTALSRVPGLKVASRNSAFVFKSKREDPRRVGQALHVATLLEGSLRKAGNQIRVSAQLINAVDGFQLWSETYDRSVNDIIAVQEDIAQRIAQRLQGQVAAPLKRQVVAPEAHKLYLLGRLFWNKRTEAGLKKAIELFQSAIEQDATYAPAQAALASSYLLLPQYSFDHRQSDFRPLARAAANRALELDASCAEAHTVLAMLLFHDREYAGSEEHFQRALESDPNYATGHHWYGLCLEQTGRMDKALIELRKALDLDPLSPIIHSAVSEWYFLNRRYNDALTESQKVVDEFPDFPAARLGLILPRIQEKHFPEALEEIKKARDLQPDQPLAMLDLKCYCLARQGQEAEARQIVQQLEQARQQGKPVEGSLASAYLGLREYDKAFEMAEQLRLLEGLEPDILINPMLDEVRPMPQFQLLIQRAGLTNAPLP